MGQFMIILNHLCLMEFPPLSIGRIHFEFKGCWVVIHNSLQFLNYSMQAEGGSAIPYQTPRSVASDLVLHCLSMSHLIDARLTYEPDFFFRKVNLEKNSANDNKIIKNYPALKS